jgi:hypothetical protein
MMVLRFTAQTVRTVIPRLDRGIQFCGDSFWMPVFTGMTDRFVLQGKGFLNPPGPL